MSWQSLGKVLVLSLLFLSFNPAMAANPVNINNADVDTLVQNIVGVGPKKAEAIVIYRKVHGPFKSVDDLTKVKGIGHRLVERNRESLTVSSNSSQRVKELLAQHSR